MAEPTQVNIEVPADQQGGRYANFLTVWHTPHEFTLDFSTMQPQSSEDSLDVQVVSRIRIPPTLVFDVLRALNENMTRYEDSFGPITRLDNSQSPADNLGGDDDDSDR